MLGNDVVTLYKKQPDGSFARHVIPGVQWSDKSDVANVNGRTSVTTSISVTFFEGTYDGIDLLNFSEEDAIFLGEIKDEVVDGRISALLKTYTRSGVIKSVNDNSNRDYLKNIKVVLV